MNPPGTPPTSMTSWANPWYRPPGLPRAPQEGSRGPAYLHDIFGKSIPRRPNKAAPRQPQTDVSKTPPDCSRSFQDGGIPAHECVCGVVGSEWAGPKNTQMLLRSVFQDLSGGSETQCSIVLISLLHVAQREGHLPNDDDDDAA